MPAERAAALTDAEVAAKEAAYLAEARNTDHPNGATGREIAAQLAGYHARQLGRPFDANPFPLSPARPCLGGYWSDGWTIRDRGAQREANPKAPPPHRRAPARPGMTHAAYTHPEDD